MFTIAPPFQLPEAHSSLLSRSGYPQQHSSSRGSARERAWPTTSSSAWRCACSHGARGVGSSHARLLRVASSGSRASVGRDHAGAVHWRLRGRFNVRRLQQPGLAQLRRGPGSPHCERSLRADRGGAVSPRLVGHHGLHAGRHTRCPRALPEPDGVQPTGMQRRLRRPMLHRDEIP